MRRHLFTLLLAVVIQSALPFEALGQTPPRDVVEIRLKDGSMIVGRIVSEDGGRAVDQNRVRGRRHRRTRPDQVHPTHRRRCRQR
jgi:hypothetical protein